MGNKFFSSEEEEDIFNLSDLTEEEEKPYTESIVKRCFCGYRGPLVPDVLGYVCANCGHLLIEDI